MKTLVSKDIKLMGFFSNMVLALWAITFAPSFLMLEDRYIRLWGWTILITFMIGIIHSLLNHKDNNGDKDIVLNFLPIDKKIIVSSRYITILIYVLVSSCLIYISFYLGKSRFIYRVLLSKGGIEEPTLSELLWTVGINMLIWSIYLPIDYYFKNKFDEKDELFLVIVGVLILVARISMKLDNNIYRFMNNINYQQLPFGLLMVSLLVYLLSIYISINIYKNKEF